MPFYVHFPLNLIGNTATIDSFILPIVEAARQDSVHNTIHVYIRNQLNRVSGEVEYEILVQQTALAPRLILIPVVRENQTLNNHRSGSP